MTKGFMGMRRAGTLLILARAAHRLTTVQLG